MNFQTRVGGWLWACFGGKIAQDKVERNHRFLEEALELVQSLGQTKEEAHALVEYVYGRPLGQPTQEVGGTMVTLAALCFANEIEMMSEAEYELKRVNQSDIMKRIREKQKTKPQFGPLPGVYPEREPVPPRLTVWEGAMPESNGKSNFTVMLMRKDEKFADSITEGICIYRSEYPDRARYEADCMRHLIGELPEKPWITDYDADLHSGYKPQEGDGQ